MKKQNNINLNELQDLSHHERFIKLSELSSHSAETKKALNKSSEVLDKYYTKSSVALNCFHELEAFLTLCYIDEDQLLFVEPSAGSGVFLDVLKGRESLGLDIAPNHPDVKQHDFLKDDLQERLKVMKASKGNHLIFLGNPPFGKKASLAIDFINRAFGYGTIVAFILPIQFRKWSAQSKIRNDAILVRDMDLPENAFEFMGKDYKLRCCFQIWVLPEAFHLRKDLKQNEDIIKFQNLRIQGKPPVSHEDFSLYQYNRTEEAKKFFDYDWDFAVPRQGYLDYSVKAFKKGDCDQKQQWIFFKANNKKILKNLLSLDFVKLSKKNIGLPGFGKADVVQEYIEKFG